MHLRRAGFLAAVQKRYTGASVLHNWTSNRRLWLILLVLCATLYGQALSFTDEQETHHASQHCCGLCHLGPVPILPVQAATVVAPVFSPVWLANSDLLSIVHEIFVSSAPSRAPPIQGQLQA